MIFEFNKLQVFLCSIFLFFGFSTVSFSLTPNQILTQAQQVRESIKPFRGNYVERTTDPQKPNTKAKLSAGKYWSKLNRSKTMQTYPVVNITMTKGGIRYQLNNKAKEIQGSQNILSDDLSTYAGSYNFTQSENRTSYTLTGIIKKNTATIPSKIELLINKNTFTLDQETYWVDTKKTIRN